MEPKHPGRQCCEGCLPLYDGIKASLLATPTHSVVRRDKVVRTCKFDDCVDPRTPGSEYCGAHDHDS